MVDEIPTKYCKGDVVLVSFPYAHPDGTQLTKRRPAVIVSGNRYHENLQDVLVVPLTTTTKSETKDVTVKVLYQTDEGQRAGLRVDSYIDCSVIATMPKNLLVATIGSFPPRTMQAIGNCLKKVLELDD